MSTLATPGAIDGGFDLAWSAAATVDGTVQVCDGDLGLKPMKATAEIVSVVAGPESTALSWRLLAPETTSLPSRGWFVRGLGNTRAVALVAGDQLLRPVVWQNEGNQFDWFVDCGCSRVPFDVGPEGVEMGGLYPALPPATTSVQVRIPGFPAATVPLTRP